MESVRIPNRVTRFPVALSDLMLVAPLASRLLFRSSLPGRIVGAAAAGAYAGSAARDWLSRRRVRRLDFRRSFGLDVLSPPAMTRREREASVATLASRLNVLYQPRDSSRTERAQQADRALTDFIAQHTNQRVLTSTRVRSFMLPKLVFSFAAGVCDRVSGEVAIFRDLGIFEAHVIAHEFSHRKGYIREVEAQLMAYLALVSSTWREGQIAAVAERLYRELVVLSDRSPERSRHLVRAAGLRPEIERSFLARCGGSDSGERSMTRALERLYDLRLRLTKQNGLSDYDEGFTNGLHYLEVTGKLI